MHQCVGTLSSRFLSILQFRVIKCWGKPVNMTRASSTKGAEACWPIYCMGIAGGAVTQPTTRRQVTGLDFGGESSDVNAPWRIEKNLLLFSKLSGIDLDLRQVAEAPTHILGIKNWQQ